MSSSSQQASSLWVIPLLSAFLIYERRSRIFAKTRFAPSALMLFGIGICLYEGSLGRFPPALHVDAVALAMLGVVISIIGAFISSYGKDAWRAASFPLGFLLFAVPIPQVILDGVVRWLQYGSAGVVNLLFVLLRVPHVHDGLRFYLSGLNIEIASECSGIRSSFSLLVLVVLISHAALRETWRRLLMVSTVVPLMLIKNGIRIVTLCLLSLYVDPSFITGSLHHSGGFVFFGLALAMEGLICWGLQHSEVRTRALPLGEGCRE
jgi:exosortase